MVEKEMINEADRVVIKMDVDKDGEADFTVIVNKDSMKKWAFKLVKFILLRFV